jgi:hypothetical protein
VSDPGRYTHCPNCLIEYRAGFTICSNCGSLLVPGPSPAQETRGEPAPSGTIEFAKAEPSEGEGPDLFSLEETPVVLASIVQEDVEAFLHALDDEEIGARASDRTDDGGVEILVHAANLMDAQAVLVEFTGDVGLVDDVTTATDDEDEGTADDMALVSTARLRDAGVFARRLRDRGLDVRLELPADASASDASASILVPRDQVDLAREILGIER